MDFDFNLYPSRNKSISWTELPNQVLLINIDNGQLYTLNDSASYIWTLLTGTKTLEAILDDMILDYDVGFLDLQKDVISLFESLIKEELIYFSKEAL